MPNRPTVEQEDTQENMFGLGRVKGGSYTGCSKYIGT